MNRHNRIKSQLGKARVARGRYRDAREYHQFLISEFMDSEANTLRDRPIRIVRSSRTAQVAALSPMPPPGIGATEAAPVAAAWAVRPATAFPAALSRAQRSAPRQPAVSPASTRTFTWSGFIKGFLLGGLPAAVLLLLYLVLAR